MTPQIITTLVIIAAMFALMLLNKFPLAVTMTLAGVALWITGIVEPAKLYSSFGGSTIIFLIGMSIEVYALEATGLVDMAAAKIFRGKVVEKERIAVFVTCLFSGIITGFISNTALVVLMRSCIRKEACLFQCRFHLRIVAVNIGDNIVTHNFLFFASIILG